MKSGLLLTSFSMRAQLLNNISRVVVKFGTGVLTDARKQLDPAQMDQLVAQVAAQRKAGREVVLVTSGAVGAGMRSRLCKTARAPGRIAGLRCPGPDALDGHLRKAVFAI